MEAYRWDKRIAASANPSQHAPGPCTKAMTDVRHADCSFWFHFRNFLTSDEGTQRRATGYR